MAPDERQGYTYPRPRSRLKSSGKNRLTVALTQQESAFELFKKYTAPKTLKVLKGAVTAAETTLNYQTLRLLPAARATGLAGKASGELHDPCSA